MANELKYESAGLTGSSLYVVIWDAAGQAWNGSAFATYTTTRTTWDIAAAEIGVTGLFQVSFPAVASGRYTWKWYLSTGTPAHDDVELAAGGDDWDGSNFGIGGIIQAVEQDIPDDFEQVMSRFDDVDTAIAAVSSGGIAVPIEQVVVPGSRVLTVGSRRDTDELLVHGEVLMTPGETLRWALDYRRTQLASGDLLDGAVSPSVPGPEFSLIDWGIYGTQVKFQLNCDAGAAVDTVETMTVTATPTVGDTIILEVTLRVI